MNSFLLYLLKSTLILSLLYLAFSLLMRQETFFKLNRMVLILMVLSSTLIPLLPSPQLIQPFRQATLEPIFQSPAVIEKPIQTAVVTESIQLADSVNEIVKPFYLSPENILIVVYLAGAFVSLLLLLYSIGSVLLLFQTARKTVQDGIPLMIVPNDLPAFSFGHCILISQHDYELHSQTIITHELSHIRMGHFYDLVLMELAKIIFWFNPLIYRMVNDLKEIHEFQADDYTLTSGIDATKYQLLIIQKCVGYQRFALANSFNHCQIKNRITMMNKQKTSKARSWKVATFLPLLALLLMAFGKPGEIVPIKVNAPPEIIQENQSTQSGLSIEIRKDGNYISNKLYSKEEIVKWTKTLQKTNEEILLIVEDQIPYGRMDEVRETLENAKIYHVNQTSPGSDEIIYPAGDVSELAKFTNGKWNAWMKNQLQNLSDGKSDTWEYKIMYGFIIDKNGKVRDGHIMKSSGNPEIDHAYEKILTKIPDWKPAKKGIKEVSVYYREIFTYRINKKAEKK